MAVIVMCTYQQLNIFSFRVIQVASHSIENRKPTALYFFFFDLTFNCFHCLDETNRMMTHSFRRFELRGLRVGFYKGADADETNSRPKS
jgi:hypothetical protein